MNKHWFWYPIVIIGAIAVYAFVSNYAVVRYQNKRLLAKLHYQEHYGRFKSEVISGVNGEQNDNINLYRDLQNEYVKNGYIHLSDTNINWLHKYVQPTNSHSK